MNKPKFKKKSTTSNYTHRPSEPPDAKQEIYLNKRAHTLVIARRKSVRYHHKSEKSFRK